MTDYEGYTKKYSIRIYDIDDELMVAYADFDDYDEAIRFYNTLKLDNGNMRLREISYDSDGKYKGIKILEEELG